MSSVMRRTSDLVMAIPRQAIPSIASDKDADTVSVSQSVKGITTLNPPQRVPPTPIAESPIHEAPAAAAPSSSLPQSATIPPISVTHSLVQEIPHLTAYIPPPVIDSTVDNPGVFTDEVDKLSQPDSVKHPHTVEPHIESAIVEEPTSYFDEPFAESIKDFEPVDDINDTTAFTEAVDENANTSFPEPDDSDAVSRHKITDTSFLNISFRNRSAL